MKWYEQKKIFVELWTRWCTQTMYWLFLPPLQLFPRSARRRWWWQTKLGLGSPAFLQAILYFRELAFSNMLDLIRHLCDEQIY